MTTQTEEIASEQIPRGYWKSATGALILVSKIKDVDKQRHALVTRLAEKAKAHSNAMRAFRADVNASVDEFLEFSAAEYQRSYGGAKGNLTLTSFDGRYKIVRQSQDRLAFDERLQIAKTLLDECAHRFSKGANKNAQVIITDAFQTDKEGKVSVGRILGLRRLKIDDPEWLKALDIVADSMHAVGSKTYVRFYERLESTGEYVAISLDMAAT